MTQAMKVVDDDSNLLTVLALDYSISNLIESFLTTQEEKDSRTESSTVFFHKDLNSVSQNPPTYSPLCT